jgi:hypothetical protein
VVQNLAGGTHPPASACARIDASPTRCRVLVLPVSGLLGCYLAPSPPRCHIPRMTIVTYHHPPNRDRRKTPEQTFPLGRIVTAKLPKKRYYGEIRYGVPDESQRTELVRQFIERELGKEKAIT